MSNTLRVSYDHKCTETHLVIHRATEGVILEATKSDETAAANYAEPSHLRFGIRGPDEMYFDLPIAKITELDLKNDRFVNLIAGYFRSHMSGEEPLQPVIILPRQHPPTAGIGTGIT